ncbi:unconventional myosin-IXb-like [Saccostrea cucullata]|uniref:unconventional myosin-IXb-like n=1 Tax=Saccostrea cuccullata TaxID=36930 RepID=UPI002ED0B22A
MNSPDDLSQLADLSEDNLTKVVKTRYEEDKIYTNVGEILLAVNPCKDLLIYTENTKKQYDWRNFEAKPPPHVFDIATRAYRRMRQAGGNQVILVCGESGAGKTESVKYMVEHLMHMVGHGTEDLNERIVKINILLESFGNARTKMNVNSSRFAKFLQLSFGEDDRVIGAKVQDYMLEKCRVVSRTSNCHEGNFHIFYALFAGLSEKEKQDLYLQKQETYEILQGSAENLQHEKKEEYRSRFKSIQQILSQIEMTEEEQKIMKKMLAAMLHLSEIKFDEKESSVKIKYEETLEQAAELLGVEKEDLRKGLIKKSATAGSENTKTEAEVNRDALVKHTYDRLFGWVVNKINKNLDPNRKRNVGKKNIGILDIPGFEKLQDNKFEQLCINFVNEQLQVSMNRILIEEERRIYQSEGIYLDIGDISKGDSCVVDIFEMKTKGLWSALDDITKLGNDDREFLEKLQSNARDIDKHHKLKFTRGKETKFSIQHFAGEIWYNCDNILEKNRDKLTEGLEDVMKKSSEKVIRSLFSADKSITGTFSVTLAMEQFSSKEMLTEKQDHIGKKGIHGRKKHNTVVSFYRESIKVLKRNLNEATPHFVRCIKPNEELRQDSFVVPFVMKQLRYNGISELSKIRSNGFPVRIKFANFFERYQMILPIEHTNETGDCVKTIINTLLNSRPDLKLNGCFKVGKYTVFMKEELSNFIEMLLKKEQDRREKKLIEEKRKQEEKFKEEERLRREMEKNKTGKNSDKNRETRETVKWEDEVNSKEKLGHSTITAESSRLSLSNSEYVHGEDSQKSQNKEEIQLKDIKKDKESTADYSQSSVEKTTVEDHNERKDVEKPPPSTAKKE